MNASNPSPPIPKIIGVVTANNISYVETVLTYLEAGDCIVVPLNNHDDHYRINAAGVQDIIVPPPSTQQWLQRAFNPSDSDTIALIAFTSGTEGQPKGIKITYKNLAEVVTRLNRVMQVDSSIKEYIGIPVYHSFGLGRCRAVCAAGGQFYIPANGFDPFEIAEMLKTDQINAISAVPSLWRILLKQQQVIDADVGRKVKWIEIGSQYMSRTEKEALRTLFPNAHIVQHYGLTEASRTTLLEIDNAQGEQLESVGQALDGIEVKIVDNQQIAIRGAHVAAEYLVDGKATPLQDEDGWFVTKDAGELKDGYLYYQGRVDDIINCGGIKVSPEQLETQIFPQLPQTHNIAICRKPDTLRGDGVLVVVTPDFDLDKAALHQLVFSALQTFGINASDAISIVDVEHLPRTASGKIQRKQLTAQYGTVEGYQFNPAALQAANQYVAPSTAEEKLLCDICQEILNIKQISVNDDVFVLGVDSLLSLRLMFKLKTQGIKDKFIKMLLSGESIKIVSAHIAAENQPTTSPTIQSSNTASSTRYQTMLNTAEAVNAFRGIAIIIVVFNHWVEGFLNKFMQNLEILDWLRIPGTPLFVIAFGLFLAYLYTDIFTKERFQRGLNMVYSRVSILILSILLFVIPKYIPLVVAGNWSATAFAQVTYNIMNYYLLVVLAVPFLLYAILHSHWRTFTALTMATASMGLAIYLTTWMDWELWQSGWLLLLKLNLLGYYGFFNLLAFSLVGMAMGIFLKNLTTAQPQHNRALWGLLVVAVLSMTIGISLDGHNYLVEKLRYFFPQLFFYSGVSLIVLLGLLSITRFSGAWGRFLINSRSVLSTIGIMTLPIYILHAYVMHVKNALMYVGLPKFAGLGIAMSGFFIVLIWMSWMVHRIKASY